MKIFLILNKRLLLALFLIIILSVLIIGRFTGSVINNKNADTHKKRIDFINNLGYKIDENSVLTKQITIPNSFSETYNKYNDLQKNAGYDLEKYRGKNATLYSYFSSEEADENLQVNLLIANGVIIGGDVHKALKDELLPLIRIRDN